MTGSRSFATAAVGFVAGVAVTVVVAAVTDGFGFAGAAGDPLAGGDPGLIVFLRADASADEIDQVGAQLGAMSDFVQAPVYCDADCSLADARILLRDEPATLALIDETNIPTSWRAYGVEGITVHDLGRVAEAFEGVPAVYSAEAGERRLRLPVGTD